ncbi:MAG: hypothetical protein AB1414_10300, partial [bacterium]
SFPLRSSWCIKVIKRYGNFTYEIMRVCPQIVSRMCTNDFYVTQNFTTCAGRKLRKQIFNSKTGGFSKRI